MFDWLRYRYKLARLQIARRKHIKVTSEESKPDMRDFYETYWQQLDEVATLQTDYFSDLAAKRLIPIPKRTRGFLMGDIVGEPDPDSKWRRAKTGRHLLTDEALRELRVALRADRRERLEIVRAWIAAIGPGLAGLTGLIGAIIGLLVVILGRR
jgi:hypothetical protein